MIEQMIAMYLIPFLQGMAVKYPIIFSIVAVMGIARALFKPTMALIETYVASTESDRDNLALESFRAGKIFKAIVFAMDYIFSIKLQKPTEPTPEAKPE